MSAAVAVLAGDVGGTKTDIAIFSSDAGVRAPLARATFQNHRYASLEAIALEFLDETKVPVVGACFDVAGPVVDGEARITNLPWVVSEASLKDALHLASVHLLNDLEATALAVPLLGAAELHTLSAGQPRRNGPVAVIAPGTGLGEAFLTWDDGRYHAHASEGGHTDFGPATPLQIDLLAYLQRKFDHVSYELVCSGIGIQHVYQYLKDAGSAAELPAVAAQIAAADDATPIIMEAGLASSGRSELCAATLELFASILGAESGNLALKVLSTGGVFLGGGIPPRMLALLEGRPTSPLSAQNAVGRTSVQQTLPRAGSSHGLSAEGPGQGSFMRAFLGKGRLSHVLVEMPVHVILGPAALIGAAQFGLSELAATR